MAALIIASLSRILQSDSPSSSSVSVSNEGGKKEDDRRIESLLRKASSRFYDSPIEISSQSKSSTIFPRNGNGVKSKIVRRPSRLKISETHAYRANSNISSFNKQTNPFYCDIPFDPFRPGQIELSMNDESHKKGNDSSDDEEKEDSFVKDTFEKSSSHNAKGEEFSLHDFSATNFESHFSSPQSEIRDYEVTDWGQMSDPLTSPMNNLDQSFSKMSVYSDSGVSAMYTSRPEVDNDLQNDPRDGQSSPSVESIRVTPTSSQYTITGYSASPSQSSSSLQLVNPTRICDETLSQILEEGDEEFRTKYSSWISQLFHLQLTKVHRRLSHHYHRKMEQMSRTHQKEIRDIGERHTRQVNELEMAGDKLRNWIETLAEENKRVKKTKQVIVEEMHRAAVQAKVNFQAELDRQLNLVQAECEKEKLELNQRHGQQLKIFLDKSCTQIEKVDSDFKAQVDALQTHVNDLQARNENLEEQVRVFKRLSENPGPNSLRPPVSSGSYCFRKEKEHLLTVIQDLKNKLYDADREKSGLISEYEEKLCSLKEDFYRHDKELIRQLDGSQRNFETLHEAHENEIKKYQAKLAEQDANSQEIIAKLREKYGDKIKSLMDMVECLQHDISCPDK